MKRSSSTKKQLEIWITLIVDTTQIFAEFNSSETPQDNIRNFISYAGTFWKEPNPKYFLLVGNRSKLPNFDDIFDFSPYIDTAHTDYKFSVNKFGIDSTISSFQIGRVPANTSADIENYFNKVINFEVDTTYSNWMNNNLFVTQYYPDSIYALWTESTTNSIMEQYPDYFTNYFFTENDTSPNYGNRDSILNFLNTKGATALWLIGVTHSAQFGYYNILDTSDVENFNNNPKNFITFFFTRQFFSTDDSAKGLADRMLMDDNTSIAIVSPVGHVFVGQQRILLEHLSQNLFGTERRSIADAINEVRNQIGYSYTNRMMNLWGDPSLHPKYDITVNVGNIESEIPKDYVLSQNYPNPFNPTTNIKYQIAEHGFVSLKVYDVLGSEIATIVNEEKLAGSHEIKFDGSTLPSGIYFYQLRTGNFVETKKMIYLK